MPNNMTPERQKEFITELCDGLRDQLLSKADRLPESWDGIEIRQWIIDTAQHQIPVGTMSRGRKRDYKNDVLVNNL